MGVLDAKHTLNHAKSRTELIKFQNKATINVKRTEKNKWKSKTSWLIKLSQWLNLRSDKQQPIILPFNFPKIQNSSQKMTNKTKDIVLAKFIAVVSKWNCRNESICMSWIPSPIPNHMTINFSLSFQTQMISWFQ